MFGKPTRERQWDKLRGLEGQKVICIREVDADEGIRIEFSGSSVLEIGYSGGEGNMTLDGEEIEF